MGPHPSLRDASVLRRRHLQNWDDGRLWSSVYIIRSAMLASLAVASWIVGARDVALVILFAVLPFTVLVGLRHRSAGKAGWLLPADQYLTAACLLLDPRVAIGVISCQLVGAVNGAIGSDRRTVERSIVAGGVVVIVAGIIHRDVTILAFGPSVTLSSLALCRFVAYIQHRYLSAHHRYEELLDGINAFVVESDVASGKVLYMNRRARELLGGWQGSEGDLLRFLHPDDRSSAQIQMQTARDTARTTSFEIRIQQRDGRYIYMEQRITFSKVAAARRQRSVLIDISARKEAERELHYRATHDALTDLPNRRLFRDRLEQAVARTARHRRPFTVMVIDLNDFKKINDDLGHEAGDTLLVETARRLTASVRAVDTVARLGGDEFAILLDETDLAQSIVVVERCLDSLKTPTLLGDSPVVAGASFGLVSAPDGGETADSLMRHADMAMYQAKRLGIGYHMYNGVLTNSELERIVLP